MSSLEEEDECVDFARRIVEIPEDRPKELLRVARSAERDLIKVTAWSCVKEFVDNGTIPDVEMMEAMVDVESSSPRVASYLSLIFFDVAMRKRSFQMLARYLGNNPGACSCFLDKVIHQSGRDATLLVAHVIIEGSSRLFHLRPLVEALADLLRTPRFFKTTMDAISSLVEDDDDNNNRYILARELALAAWALFLQGLQPTSQLAVLRLVPADSKFHAAFADRLLSGSAAVAA